MKKQSMAENLKDCGDFDLLWENVEYVERLEEGGDLYTYPDGSKLKVQSNKKDVVVN